MTGKLRENKQKQWKICDHQMNSISISEIERNNKRNSFWNAYLLKFVRWKSENDGKTRKSLQKRKKIQENKIPRKSIKIKIIQKWRKNMVLKDWNWRFVKKKQVKMNLRRKIAQFWASLLSEQKNRKILISTKTN